MAKIGFQSDKIKNSKAEEETLQTVEHTIQAEILNINSFQNVIRKELKELDHFKDNFQLIERFVQSMEKLSEKRQATIIKIRFLQAKRISEIDLSKIKAQFEIIRRIDQELNPMLVKAKEEIARLLVEESHIVYSSDKNTRAIMDTIDTELRLLQITIRNIQTRLEGTYNELTQIHTTITKLERERSNTLQSTAKTAS